MLESDVDNCAGDAVQCPEVLIVAPTRELGAQIADEAKKFAHKSKLKTYFIYGGTSTWRQKERLRDGVNILVATPGRLHDFHEQG